MMLNTIHKVKLFQLLFLIDQDLAERQRVAGCPYCGSALHYGSYHRKPRGGPENLPDEWLLRHSLCCSSEKCRRRVLPPSCRFCGRKVYWAAVILIVMTLKQQRTDSWSAAKLIKQFGFSRQTFKRWIVYFQDVFPASKIWKRIKSRLGFYHFNWQLPGDVLRYFMKHSDSNQTGIIRSLKFLSGGFETMV